jgi:hypothetical protein
MTCPSVETLMKLWILYMLRCLSLYSVWLRTGRTGFDSRKSKGIFPPVSVSEVHAFSYSLGTGGPFVGGKARPGRDADQSPLSSAEVKNE